MSFLDNTKGSQQVDKDDIFCIHMHTAKFVYILASLFTTELIDENVYSHGEINPLLS